MIPSRIIQGHDGPVEFDVVNRTVTKTYLDRDHRTAIRKAQREAKHLARLHDALARVDGVSCPRLLAWDESPPPRVVMTLCAGVPLAPFLGGIGGHDARIPDIAARIHDGLDAYIGVFQEPHYDFCFENMLYDEVGASLTLLDFGIPAGVDGPDSGAPLEASLGALVGAACYNLSRPTQLFARRTGCVEMLRAVLAGFEDRISRRRVCVLARATFSRLTRPGAAFRRSYYRTAGAVIARLYFARLNLHPPQGGSTAISGRRDRESAQ